MRILPVVACAAAVVSASDAASQTVLPCDGIIEITMISEPWDLYSRTYAEGAIRLFEANVAPTMAAGAVIGVLHPVPGDPHPHRVCTAVLHDDPYQRYFAEALIWDATASYDPATGLTIRVPVRFPDGRPLDAVSITVNHATGEVRAR